MDDKVFIDLLSSSGEDRLSVLPEEILDSVPQPEPKYDPEIGVIYRVLEPNFGKQALDDVTEALRNGEVSSGTKWPKRMAEMITKMYSVPVAIPTSSGASALHVALLATHVYRKEVIIPAFTMVAVANMVKLAGATPIFADSAPDNINPSLNEISKLYNEDNTKAVIICHTYGIPCPDIDKIAEWCKEKDITLIEDICESMGTRLGLCKTATCEEAKYTMVGTHGDYSCASLYANKQITAGDGGWIHSKHPDSINRLRSLINHGFDPQYHFLHFETAPNAKINGLGAALVVSQLGTHLHNEIDRRHQIAGWYRGFLSSKNLSPKFVKGINHSGYESQFFDAPWVFGMEVDSRENRDELRKFLASHGIESRNYFYPLHLQPVNYLECERQVENSYETWKLKLPNALRFASHGFYVPTHSYLEKPDVEFIVDVMAQFYLKDRNTKFGKAPRQKGWVDVKRGQKLDKGDIHVEISNGHL